MQRVTNGKQSIHTDTLSHRLFEIVSSEKKMGWFKMVFSLIFICGFEYLWKPISPNIGNRSPKCIYKNMQHNIKEMQIKTILVKLLSQLKSKSWRNSSIIKNTCVLPRVPGSVHITHIGKLTSTCNSNSRRWETLF